MNGKMIAFAALLLILAAPFPARTEPPPEIRVLIIDAAPQVTIEGMGAPLRIAGTAGREERIGASARVAAGESGLVVRGADRGDELAFTDASRRYRIGSRLFKGQLVVRWKGPGSLMVVDNLPLEDYLAGLINSEISSSWPVESIKAQAVAARSYAMHQIDRARHATEPKPYDITGTMLDQVYDGAHQEDHRSQEAVAATRGQLLLRSGALFPAYYHSCCGGQTEHAHNVWPGEEGPPTTQDAWCARSPKLLWSFEVPIRTFLEGLRGNGVAVRILRTVATSLLPDSPRAEMLLLEDEDGMKMVRTTELRRIFGFQNIKSTWFEAAIRDGMVVFTGRGYGHGVGLCQWGAKGMAEAGYPYRDILKHYYPDAEVVTLY